MTGRSTALYKAVSKTPQGRDATKRILDYVRAGGTPHCDGILMRRRGGEWELVGPESGAVFRGTLTETVTAMVRIAGPMAINVDLNPDIPISVEV